MPDLNNPSEMQILTNPLFSEPMRVREPEPPPFGTPTAS